MDSPRIAPSRPALEQRLPDVTRAVGLVGLDEYRADQRERGARSLDGLPAQEPLDAAGLEP